jgi:mRNA interferase MazF
MTKKPSRTSKHSYSQGDIVVVPFPYSDQLAEKRRPAVVISNAAFNTGHPVVWIAMITSSTQNTWSSDLPLPSSESGLRKPSIIRTAKIATVEPQRIIRKLSKLSAKTQKRLAKTLLTAMR